MAPGIEDSGASSFCPVSVGMFVSLSTKNFNLGQNFLTIRGTAFIFHRIIPLYKTFPLVPKFLTS